ncbi:MAG: hypothetical protein MJE77_20875 [Proteobacteria bacterium]|nr:hypothetical protein [Pseudomonadota bacterium]
MTTALLTAPAWRGSLSVLAIALAIAGCRPTLESLQSCGDQVLCPAEFECAADQRVCLPDGCGNGVVDRADGEFCDDGNVRAGDGCATDCSRCDAAWQSMIAEPRWHVTSLWGTGPDDIFAVGAIGPTIDLATVFDRSRWTPHLELVAPPRWKSR